ncbi:MAG: Fic family protein [Hyphomicrobiaceae bacterium]|nr:MAG: Fic family protein [Hyphomicrobiaceae bacterium]
MAKPIPEDELQAIEDAVRQHPDGASLEQIELALKRAMPRRTLQHRLKHLVSKDRLAMSGERRWARYRNKMPGEERVIAGQARIDDQASLFVPLSKQGAAIQAYVRQPEAARRPVGYDRKFLDTYRPNKTAYLSSRERDHLRGIGTPPVGDQPAGTYAKQILSRLLIDLSWNSSRLEGNTYSLLDTKRLLDLGRQAEGKDQFEAQMILNHKDAIEFLVSEAEEIGFNRYTILNLHGMLANNLLSDADAPGRLRRSAVGITGSVFHPLEASQVIEECFDQILATAAAIKDPFEQGFFVMVQLPCLQAFDDVNKRVSRLAANIPLIRNNLSPLSFADVPQQTYTEAMLGVYELQQVDLLKDVFIWGYERSASRYAAVRQSLGDPDPFRLRHRAALRALVAEVVHGRMDKKDAAAYVAAWTAKNIETAERGRFAEMAETELLALHEGNFARYQIKPSEFAAWQKAWNEDA